MKKIFSFSTILFLNLFLANDLFGQTAYLCREVVASAGGYATAANKKFEQTIGESVIHTIGNGTRHLSQGFQQPEVCPLLTMINTSDIAGPSGLKIFPNPSAGEIFLRFENPQGIAFRLQVFDAMGHWVKTLPESDDTYPSTVDCRSFSSGIYFLVAHTLDGRLFFRQPFVKTDR